MLNTSLLFMSKVAVESGLPAQLGLRKTVVAVEKCRSVGKADMIHNDATPVIEVDPETYDVHADGELLTCEPAAVLPMGVTAPMPVITTLFIFHCSLLQEA